MSHDREPREEDIRRVILEKFHAAPPTIVMVGVSGVGKSTTLNRMFKTNMKVSHTTAGTLEFQANEVELTPTSGAAKGEPVGLRVIDAPGLGEDLRRDPDYLRMYDRHLPDGDIILWVVSARNRALALDQTYLRRFEPFADRIVVGLSQVDLIEPMDWPEGSPIPSPTQRTRLDEIVADRTEKLAHAAGRPLPVIPYSAKYGFNLETLFAALIDRCPEEKSWMFGALKNFSFRDFLAGPPAANGRKPRTGPPAAKATPSLFARLFGSK